MPMSIAKGAGSRRSKRTRVPFAVSGEDLGAAAAVDLGGVGGGAALVEVGVVARVPDHAVVAALAEHLVVGVAAGQRVVLGAAEELVEAALAENGVVARLAEQQVVAGAAGDRVVAGAAEDVGARQRAVRLVEGERRRCRPGRTSGSARCWRPSARRRVTATAPPLTRIWPAALRLTTMLLPRLSPNTVRTPVADENEAVTAMGSSNWVAKNPVYNAGSASPEGARGNSGNHGASCAGVPVNASGRAPIARIEEYQPTMLPGDGQRSEGCFNGAGIVTAPVTAA